MKTTTEKDRSMSPTDDGQTGNPVGERTLGGWVDLRALYGDRWLERQTWQAVRQVVAAVPRLRAATPDEPAPARALALLTFCYATGVYASEDVEYALQRGGLPRSLVPRQPVSVAWLQAFRRANRPWIELALAGLLARLPVSVEVCREEAHAAGADASPHEHRERCLRCARRAVELAVQLDTALCD